MGSLATELTSRSERDLNLLVLLKSESLGTIDVIGSTFFLPDSSHEHKEMIGLC